MSSITNAEPPMPAAPQRIITWRSITLGLLGTIFICGLTPYNDYALNNTFLVGNNLPIGVVLIGFMFILFVNGPLNRWAPRHAFTAGELTVGLMMTLASCALPSSGLMRFLPASLVMPFWHAAQNAQHMELLESLSLPRWMFPDFAGDSPSEWANDPLVTAFWGRWTGDDPVPYLKWAQPALTWGIFHFALFGAMLCMVSIVRRQWVENERLPFPLAQIYLSLVEQPAPGRMANTMLRSGLFWIGFSAVFLLHVWNGLALSAPRSFPEVPVRFDLTELLSDPPWSYAMHHLAISRVYFAVVGVTFFLSRQVSFSLWFFFILFQVYRMMLGTMTGDPATPGHPDAHFGGILAFALLALWIGRRHWWLVIAQALRGPRAGEPRGRYLSFPFAFWGLLMCAGIMTGWLAVAGATIPGAAVTVLLLLMLFFTITRIIAETGLVHGQLGVPIYKPFEFAAVNGLPHVVPTQTFFLTSMIHASHFHFREVLAVYAAHGMRVADQTIYSGRHAGREDDPVLRRTGRRLILLMLLALSVGYVVSFGSTLWTNYHHGWTKDVTEEMPINRWATDPHMRGAILNATHNFDRDSYHLRHNPAGHFIFGFLLVGLLGFLRLSFTWWPLHPVGYLMVGTFPGNVLWFSILIGWLCKTLVVRFGGARMYLAAMPFFIGLIVGESIAAGLWLIVGIVLSALEVPYAPVRILPW